MAQILKKEVKEQIINSARNEVLLHGIKESSLRDIAKGANITVGNLYRYFKNKDDIIKSITNNTLIKINSLLKLATNQMISFDSDAEKIKLSNQELVTILNSIASGIALLYINHRSDLIILIKYSKDVEYIKEWFEKVAYVLIRDNSKKHNKDPQMVKYLSMMIADSVFSGVEKCLLIDDLDQVTIEELLQIYFKTFISMLNVEWE